MAAMIVNGSGQNEQSLETTLHRCYLPSFTSLGWGVSEEKIKMWKVNGWRTPSDGKSSHCLWQGELKKLHQNKMKYKYAYLQNLGISVPFSSKYISSVLTYKYFIILSILQKTNKQ